jgi:phosphoserine phosphatase
MTERTIRGIVAFDLDGTLLRGETVCELLARPLGRTSEMSRIEALSAEEDIAQGRVEMVGWYAGLTHDEMRAHLPHASWAPGAQQAVRTLQDADVIVGIVSYTWAFAVQWFAQQIGVTHHLGTSFTTPDDIRHVWAHDKAQWVLSLANEFSVPHTRTAAVGDTRGDAQMLRAVSLPFFVGASPLEDVAGLIHLPGADLRLVAKWILDEWT